MNKEMTLEEATKFFSELYRGEHHIPGYKVNPWGHGWSVSHDRGEMATTDFNDLTRFVLMCHEYCYRGSIESDKGRTLKIAIWKRQREGGISEAHPTIEQALAKFNNRTKLA